VAAALVRGPLPRHRAAIGITAILRLIFRGRTAIAIPIAALIAAGFIVREGWTSATTEPYRKLNWRVIAATIHEHAHARDAVVTTNDWSYVCLDFYLRQLPPKVCRRKSRGWT
jgi:hypothetical protein